MGAVTSATPIFIVKPFAKTCQAVVDQNNSERTAI